MGKTHSICRFPLHDISVEECSVRGNEDRTEVGVNEDLNENVHRVLNNLSEVVQEFSMFADEVSMREEIATEQEVVNEGVNGNDSEYEGPVTRARGSVPEHEWVMRKGL